MFKKVMLPMAACCGAIALCSCSTTYDTDLKVDYVDRASVEKLANDEISSQSFDLKQMKNEKKLGIGVLVNVSDMTQGRCRLPDSVNLTGVAWKLAQNFLAQTKAYQVYVFPQGTSSDKLMSSNEFEGVKFAFLIEMNVVLSSEIEERLDHDEAMYKTTIDWKLIDNRTKASGLGELTAATVKESLVCRAITTRNLKVASVRNRQMGGTEVRNAQNAYFNTLANAMLQFRAQLSNRIPYGGAVIGIRLRDGKLRMTMTGGRETGIVPKMQMLIINEEGDQVAVATATGGAQASQTTLDVWRWLSPSMKKSIMAVAGDKKQLEAWMEEDGNKLYAICLGTPKPSKDEITNFNDTK